MPWNYIHLSTDEKNMYKVGLERDLHELAEIDQSN